MTAGTAAGRPGWRGTWQRLSLSGRIVAGLAAGVFIGLVVESDFRYFWGKVFYFFNIEPFLYSILNFLLK